MIYSTTDESVARPLIADFQAMYPKIEIDYEDLTSTELHHRFIAEFQLGPDSADVLWSSAMDQQSSLVSNGYAATYESPEGAGLPAWAKWKGQAYATTFEPVVIAYNKKLLKATEVPRTHADLARLLNTDTARFKGKVITYDIEKSGLGFFLATQDVNVAPAFWDIAQALGKLDRATRPRPIRCCSRCPPARRSLPTTCLGPMRSNERARILPSATFSPPTTRW